MQAVWSLEVSYLPAVLSGMLGWIMRLQEMGAQAKVNLKRARHVKATWWLLSCLVSCLVHSSQQSKGTFVIGNVSMWVFHELSLSSAFLAIEFMQARAEIFFNTSVFVVSSRTYRQCVKAIMKSHLYSPSKSRSRLESSKPISFIDL